MLAAGPRHSMSSLSKGGVDGNFDLRIVKALAIVKSVLQFLTEKLRFT